MAELERIVAKIEADTSELRRDLNRMQGEFNQFTTKTERGVSGVTKAFKALGAAVATHLTISALRSLGGAALNVVSQFEDLQDSLNVVFGGLEQGEAAMNQILNTANRTPFAIQDLTQAFITLQASGVAPTTDLLMTFADTASVTTNRLETFNALVRVMSRSVGGGLGLEELNQIADRGIPVWRILEEELGKNRLELSEVGKTAAGAKRIMDALINGLNKRFGGATENALDNISVATSNFADALSALTVQLSDFTGAGDFFVDLVNSVTEAMVRWRLELKLIDEEGIDALIDLRQATLGSAFALFESAEAMEAYDKALFKAVTGTEAATEATENQGSTVSEFAEKVKAATAELKFETEQLKRSAEDQYLYDLAKKEGVTDTEAFVEAMRPYVQQLFRAQEAHDDLAEAIEREEDAKEDAKKTTDELVKAFMSLRAETRTAEETFADTVLKLDVLKAKLEAIGIVGPEVEEVFNRAKDAARETMEEANKSAVDLGEVLEDMGASFSSSFEEAIVQGKEFREVIQGLLDDLLQIAIRKMILGPLTSALFGEEGFLGGFLPSAKGNAFQGGRLLPFAKGGVVSSPTVFPMARGAGIMGEAGPEAILPLKRGPGGVLGVTSSGGGGKTVVNVYAPPGSQTREERQQFGDTEAINLYIENTVADGINRPGSKIHRSLRSTFGSTPQVVPR